jgi:hypothetical protein
VEGIYTSGAIACMSAAVEQACSSNSACAVCSCETFMSAATWFERGPRPQGTDWLDQQPELDVENSRLPVVHVIDDSDDKH